MKKELVSIIIPTYNRPLYLKRAIDSALKQTYENIEVIVVDDNNPNTEGRKATEALMGSYAHLKNVYYLRHPKNKNGSAARNTGASFSHGQYLAFLDDDDEFLPNKIDSQIKRLKTAGKEYGVCYSNYKRLYDEKEYDKNGEKREGHLYLEALKRNLFVQAGSNLVIEKAIFNEINGFDESFARNQDLEFLIRLLKKTKICYSDELGLVIHLYKRVSKVDFEAITDKYLKTFSGFIEELSSEEKREVELFVALQLYRYYLLDRKIKIARHFRKENGIKLTLATKYLFHLLLRKTTKKCCGFIYRRK